MSLVNNRSDRRARNTAEASAAEQAATLTLSGEIKRPYFNNSVMRRYRGELLRLSLHRCCESSGKSMRPTRGVCLFMNALRHLANDTNSTKCQRLTPLTGGRQLNGHRRLDLDKNLRNVIHQRPPDESPWAPDAQVATGDVAKCRGADVVARGCY